MTFEPVSDQEGVASLGEPTPENPVMVAAWFLNAATQDKMDYSVLRQLVTPESWASWGSFAEVREKLASCGIASKVDPAAGVSDVVYAKYLDDPEQPVRLRSEGDVLVFGLIATLVHRPELGGWRVHAVGDYVLPEDVPRG
jgi:hypothetical protein